jgi:hypothetical protein
MTLTQQYLIYIRADTLAEATEQSLHLTYWFLTQALQEQRRGGRNGEFEAFALEALALLQKHRHLYTKDVEAVDAAEDPGDGGTGG